MGGGEVYFFPSFVLIWFLWGLKKIRMLLYLKICSWNGTFIALVYQMAKKVRITKGNHIVPYLLLAVNISVSGKANYTACPKCWFNISRSPLGLSALFNLYRHPPLFRKNGEEGLFPIYSEVRWGRNNRTRQISFFWTSDTKIKRTSEKLANFFLFDKWNNRDKKLIIETFNTAINAHLKLLSCSVTCASYVICQVTKR